MSLERIDRLMGDAQRRGYAIGYFESWNLESLQGVIDAAEETRSPIIIGFNGEFLSQRAGAVPEELKLYAALGVAAVSQTNVPCGFIFNECSDDAWVESAIGAGFNLVMPADPNASVDEYIKRVARITVLAHSRGVAVEAEIDELPCGEHAGAASDPQVAANFVKATGVDLLAISVGNEHIKLEGRAPLDLDRLREIREKVDIPLVLHGGSGIEDESLRQAIRVGIRKVNYGTYMKQLYLKAIRASVCATSTANENPHALLGDGSETDTMVIGRKVVRDAVLERIELLGCCGKA